MNTLFHGKTLDTKINPFLQIHRGDYQNTTFFLENANPGFAKKNTPFIHEFSN